MPATPPGPSKTFTVRIKEEPAFKHKTHLRERLIHGSWLEQDGLFQQTSPARAALRRVVPRDVAWRGLVDWETNDQGREEESLSRWMGHGGPPMSSLIRKRNGRPTFRSLLLHGRRRPDPGATENDDGEA